MNDRQLLVGASFAIAIDIDIVRRGQDSLYPDVHVTSLLLLEHWVVNTIPLLLLLPRVSPFFCRLLRTASQRGPAKWKQRQQGRRLLWTPRRIGLQYRATFHRFLAEQANKNRLRFSL